MAANKRSRDQRLLDRVSIAKWYLEGVPQAEIGRRLGITQPQVSLDLAAIRKDWQKSATLAMSEYVAQELARIDHLELTYWQAWERSTHPIRRRTTSGHGKLNDKPDAVGQSTVEIERDGNPQFLTGILSCIERRCKLLGLDNAANSPQNVIAWSPEQWRQEAERRRAEADETLLLTGSS